LNYWYIRHKFFGGISGYQISQSVLSAGGKVGFGYAGVLHGGMIYSMVIAPFISLMMSLWHGVKSSKFKCFDRFDYSHVIATAKQYRNFPLYVLPRSFINVLATQLPILLLTPFFGAEKVGLLSMALLLGYTPICTISRAVYQVLYQHITDCVHQSLCIGKIFRRFISYGSLVIIPAFALLYIVLPDLTGWLLGSEWYVVGKYIRWMLPWLYVSLLTGSICFLSDVFQKQKIGLVFEILLVFGRLLGLCIGVFFNDFMVAIAAYSIGTAVAIIPQLIWLISLVVKYDRSLVVGSDN
jgi:O-antigen/teichoic acid export membrane protein